MSTRAAGVTRMPPRFPTGKLCATPGVLRLGVDVMHYVKRHVRGDWSEMDAEDQSTNELAVTAEEKGRVFSAYTTPAGKIWIITEWDRSVTTVLLPYEY